MKSKPSLKQIKNDLKHLKKFEVVIYGSYATNNFTLKSDIDIAIITREKNMDNNISIWKDALKKAKSLYHINVFELLPLHLKANIIDNHITLFGNKIELSEYFYHYRRLWKDSRHRYYSNQFSSYRERMKIISLNPSRSIAISTKA